MEQRIGFIGAGHMATALAVGSLQAGLTTAERLIASDPDQAARERFAELTGAAVTSDNAEVAEAADILVLAVKPQKIADVATELRSRLTANRLLVSIAAGVSLASLADSFGRRVRVARAMPSMLCQIRRGSSAYCLGPRAKAADGAVLNELLGALGSACEIEEKQFDAVTALASSGPALVYVMIEALADGGVAAGLPRRLAAQMAAEAVRGAAEMVLTTGEHPAALRDRVTSPAGTTIAGLRALEAGGVRAALMAAVDAAARRSIELGERL